MSARVFEAMVHDVRALIRVLLAGRNPEPSAAIMDARTIQSTPESGAQGAYDGAKRKRAEKCMSQWIHWVTWWRHVCLRLTNRSENKLKSLRARFRSRRAILLSLLMLIRAIQANAPNKPQRNTASGLKLSNCLRPSVASYSYRDDGSSSAPSRGWRASDGWLATTNAWTKPSRACTSSLPSF